MAMREAADDVLGKALVGMRCQHSGPVLSRRQSGRTGGVGFLILLLIVFKFE